MKRFILAVIPPWIRFALSVGMMACPHPMPPSPAPGTEAGAAPATCADVCRREAELGCEAARPTARGALCVDVCNNVQGSSVVHWNLDCRAHASSCAAIDRCESK